MKAKIEKVENYIKECRSKLIGEKNINNLSLNFNLELINEQVEQQNLCNIKKLNNDLNVLIQKLSLIDDKIKLYDDLLVQIEDIYGKINNYNSIMRISQEAYDIYKHIENISDNGILISETNKDIFSDLKLSKYLIKKNIKLLQEYDFIRVIKYNYLTIYVLNK